MKGIILAGGTGTSMLPLTSHYPKAALSLHGKPLISQAVKGLLNAGVEELIFVLGYKYQHLNPYIAELREQTDIPIKIEVQKRPHGVENAILTAGAHVAHEEHFLLAYSDVIVPPQFYRHLVNSWLNSASDAAVAITLETDLKEYGVAQLDMRGFLTDVFEQPQQLENIVGNYILAGAYIYPGEFISILEETKSLEVAIKRLLEEQRTICTARWMGPWIDVSYPWELIEANKILFMSEKETKIHQNAKISPTASISGLVIIDDGAVIDHNVTIKGPAYIGKNAYIGTNSLIRENTTIEANTKIGFSVEIKNSVIQPYTKVGRLSFIGDSVIGSHCNIVSSLTTVNVRMDQKNKNIKPFTIRGRTYQKLGVTIGNYSWIGANVVTEPYTIIDSTVTIESGSKISNVNKNKNEDML